MTPIMVYSASKIERKMAGLDEEEEDQEFWDTPCLFVLNKIIMHV